MQYVPQIDDTFDLQILSKREKTGAGQPQRPEIELRTWAPPPEKLV